MKSQELLAVLAMSWVGATAHAAHPVDELAPFTAAPAMAAKLGIHVVECPVEIGNPGKVDLAKVEVQGLTMHWKSVGGQWVWREYRVKEPGALCIELLEPLATILSRDHAAIFAMHESRSGPDGTVINDAPPGVVHDNGRAESLDDYLPPFAELPEGEMHPVDELRPLTAVPEKASSFGLRLTHCPLAGASSTLVDLTRLEKPATYSQEIERSTWTWREYSVPPTGDTCIVLIGPSAGPLAKEHAAILAMVTHGILPDGSRTLPAFKIKGVDIVAIPADQIAIDPIMEMPKEP